MSYDGVLPVFKPPHFTSHDVVGKLRHMLGMKRIGHIGTLDPLVTGVLPVCLGKATRMVEYLQMLPKQYEAELTLGMASDTEDASGRIIDQIAAELIRIDELQINNVFRALIGEIEQVPPMYSAVKVNGKKLYELARVGIEVERKPRSVTIYELNLRSIATNAEGYPTIRFNALCSKGTYIRTLCLEIGRALGYPALMSNLKRTQSGGFQLQDCLQLSEIETLHAEKRLASLLTPADIATHQLATYQCNSEDQYLLTTGRRIALPANLSTSEVNLPVRAYSSNGRFIGLLQIDVQNQQLVPKKMWSSSDEL